MHRDVLEPNTHVKMEPRAGLLDRIMAAIYDEQRFRRARVRVISFGLVALIALIAFIPAWRELQTEVTESGFQAYVSLLGSDTSVILTNIQDFGLLLAESFPVLGLAVVLTSIFAFLMSVRFVVRDIGPALHKPSFGRAMA
jgi:hypothetical protein